MKVLGVTGGVGAGKSTVLDYIQNRYGARVIQLDRVGHMVQEPGQTCYDRIVETFGTGILNDDRTVDRSRLAAAVFEDQELLQKLNRIVHPAVKEYIVREIEHEKQLGAVPFLVIEAALLLEDHYDQICDEIWYIHADEKIRSERLKRTRGYSDAKVQGIMSSQMQEAEFRSRCQLVIDNSSSIIERVHEQIDGGLREHGFL